MRLHGQEAKQGTLPFGAQLVVEWPARGVDELAEVAVLRGDRRQLDELHALGRRPWARWAAIDQDDLRATHRERLGQQ